MMNRHFLIELNYSDPDTFCNSMVGTGRVRTNIPISANESMLEDVILALTAPDLCEEHPLHEVAEITWFDLHISGKPTNDGRRILRFRFYQSMVDDEAPFTTDIQFRLSENKSVEFSNDLEIWLQRKDYPFVWKD